MIRAFSKAVSAEDFSAAGLAKLSREELARLFAHVAKASPPDATIRGGSWLYHLETYRRLFPPAYVASREPYTRPIALRGTATWAIRS